MDRLRQHVLHAAGAGDFQGFAYALHRVGSGAAAERLLMSAMDPSGQHVVHTAMNGAFREIVQNTPLGHIAITSTALTVAPKLINGTPPTVDHDGSLCPIWYMISLRIMGALGPLMHLGDRQGLEECLQERDRSNLTVLHLAVRSHASGIARLFVKSPRGLPERLRRDIGLSELALGPVPVKYANLTSILEDTDILALLEAGASPWTRDSLGRNVLHVAAQEGRTSVVEILLRRPDAHDHRNESTQGGWTARELAANGGFTELAARLAQAFPDAKALHPPVAPGVLSQPPGGWDHVPSGGYAQSDAAAHYDLRRCDFDILECDKVTGEVFNSTCAAANRPVLLAGCTKDWPAYEKWALEPLIKEYGDVQLQVGATALPATYGGKGRFVRLDEHVRAADAAAQKGDMAEFAFDSDIVGKTEGRIQADFAPPKFAPTTAAVLTEFSVGPPLSGANMHFHGAVYTTLVHGRKRWALLPPAHAYFNMRPGKEWFDSPLSRDPNVHHCIQRAGDTLFVPRNWAHATINIQTSVGIVIEH